MRKEYILEYKIECRLVNPMGITIMVDDNFTSPPSLRYLNGTKSFIVKELPESSEQKNNFISTVSKLITDDGEKIASRIVERMNNNCFKMLDEKNGFGLTNKTDA